MTPLLFLAVMGAGAVGALVRFAAVRFSPPSRFPAPILAVNAVGSFAAGLAIAATAQLGPAVSLIIATGFCGGLTTFSTFGVDSVRLWQDGHWRIAVWNAITNLALGIGCAALGVGLIVAFV